MVLPNSDIYPLHVMVVDPRGEDARLYPYLSQSFGHQVTLAVGPDEALERVECPSIEVVVIRMSPIDDRCLELVRSLRRARPDLGIVLISTDPDPQAVILAMESEVDEFCLGPSDPEQVRHVVDQLVQTRKHT
jgi:DNA-binding NarL/FixJ family response regulator